MESNIQKDCENQRKKTFENANSGEVRVFQRNAEIWNDGHQRGTQNGIEMTVHELIKGLNTKYPLFVSHTQTQLGKYWETNLLSSHWDIEEVVESIISVIEEIRELHPLEGNPDGGMELKEQILCDQMEGKDD